MLRKDYKHLLLVMAMITFCNSKENVYFLSSMGVVFHIKENQMINALSLKCQQRVQDQGLISVNRMGRTGHGDLSAAWIHFDYTRRINGRATMSCSVYDPR